ncbi:unnamed protein product, partial [Timema podura]|nr:unnamed protein product [Timema podura]
DRGLNPGPSPQKSDTLPLDHQPKKESMSNELSSLTLEQKIVSTVVEKEASRSNSFLYSSCNFDPAQVDLQFSSECS